MSLTDLRTSVNADQMSLSLPMTAMHGEDQAVLYTVEVELNLESDCNYEIRHCYFNKMCTQGFYSLSGRTSCRKISWSLEIRIQTFLIALKFDRQLSSSAGEMPVKFQSDTIIITSNLHGTKPTWQVNLYIFVYTWECSSFSIDKTFSNSECGVHLKFFVVPTY